MTRYVVVIDIMLKFEVVWEYNIVLEFFLIVLTYNAGERARRHLLTWILRQARVGRHSLHYIISLF